MRKKHLLKRVSALSLATVLILSVGLSIGGNGTVVQAATNEVANGDFDSGEGLDASGWSLGAAVAEKEDINLLTQGDFESGSTVFSVIDGTADLEVITEGRNHMLKVTATTTTRATLHTYITGTPGVEYTFSYKIKVPEAAAGTVKISPYTHISAKEECELIQSTTNNDWQTVSFKRTVPAGGSTTRLRFDISGYVGVACYLDDVKITYKGTNDKTVSVDVAENGTFASNTDGWWNSAGTMTWDSMENGVLKFTNDAAGDYLRCYVPVIGGKTYTFSYWFKGSDNSAVRLLPLLVNRTEQLDIKVTGSTDGNFTSIDPRQPGTEWKKATSTFTPHADAKYVEVRLRANSGVDTIYLDDFSFTYEANVYVDGIVMNGSDYEMKLSNGNSATYSGASLEADKYYDYSYAVTNSGLTKAGLSVNGVILTETAGTFKYTSGTVGFATEGTGVAYFDDLVISAHTHTGGTATCTAKAVCDGCEEEYGDKLPHPDVNQDEVCDVCTADLHQHTMSTEWESNGTNHWHSCTKDACEYTEDFGACAGGTATCQAKAVCTTCGKGHGGLGDHVDDNQDEKCDLCSIDMHVHDMDTAWTSDGTNHWHKCKKADCVYTEDFAPCSGGTATCTAQAVCSVCQNGHGALAQHVYSKQIANQNTLKSEATTTKKAVYYKSCECGKVSTTETFEYGFPKEETQENNTTVTAPQTGDNATRLWLYVAIVSMWVIGLSVKGRQHESKRRESGN